MTKTTKPKRGRPTLKPYERLVNISVTITLDQKRYLDKYAKGHGSVARLVRAIIQKHITAHGLEQNGDNT